MSGSLEASRPGNRSARRASPRRDGGNTDLPSGSGPQGSFEGGVIALPPFFSFSRGSGRGTGSGLRKNGPALGATLPPSPSFCCGSSRLSIAALQAAIAVSPAVSNARSRLRKIGPLPFTLAYFVDAKFDSTIGVFIRERSVPQRVFSSVAERCRCRPSRAGLDVGRGPSAIINAGRRLFTGGDRAVCVWNTRIRGDLSNADAAVPPLLGRGPRPPTPDVRAALHDPDSLFGEASEKLTQRKEVNQAADHDGRQPRQHNVRIR